MIIYSWDILPWLMQLMYILHQAIFLFFLTFVGFLNIKFIYLILNFDIHLG